MQYRIKVTKQFENDFAKSEKTLKERMMKRIDRLKTDPYSCKALHGGLKGKYSLRVGDYRVIYTIDEDEKIVTLYCAGHRKKVYERMDE